MKEPFVELKGQISDWNFIIELFSIITVLLWTQILVSDSSKYEFNFCLLLAVFSGVGGYYTTCILYGKLDGTKHTS